jgi:hypothetical protein
MGGGAVNAERILRELNEALSQLAEMRIKRDFWRAMFFCLLASLVLHSILRFFYP